MAPGDDTSRGIDPSYRNSNPGLDDVSRGLAPRGGAAPTRVADRGHKRKAPGPAGRPHLVIIGVDSALTQQQGDAIAQIATKALKVTTDEATDPRVKVGVEVTYHLGLPGSERLRKRGDITVYVVSGTQTYDKRIKLVREILRTRHWDADKRNRTSWHDKLKEDSQKLADYLREDNVYDPRTGVAIVDITGLPKHPSAANLTAVAGTVMHESLAHPAGLRDVARRGIMSEKTPWEATAKDIIFEKADRKAVNAYLLLRAEDPRFEYE